MVYTLASRIKATAIALQMPAHVSPSSGCGRSSDESYGEYTLLAGELELCLVVVRCHYPYKPWYLKFVDYS